MRIRLTRNTVEVFYDGNRISSQVRLYGERGQTNTLEEHMPPNHRQYLKWDSDHFREAASLIGTCTGSVIESILLSYKVEQQGYKTCMALLKLADLYTVERLEAACSKAFFYSTRPSYKTIQTILKTGLDKPPKEAAASTNPNEHSFIRGADYYGGGQKQC